MDSLLEGARFEPSVPRQRDNVFRDAPVQLADGDGFIERPDVPAPLREAYKLGCAIDLADLTYHVCRETVVPADDEIALPRWLEALFAFMQRNSAT